MSTFVAIPVPTSGLARLLSPAFHGRGTKADCHNAKKSVSSYLPASIFSSRTAIPRGFVTIGTGGGVEGAGWLLRICQRGRLVMCASLISNVFHLGKNARARSCPEGAEDNRCSSGPRKHLRISATVFLVNGSFQEALPQGLLPALPGSCCPRGLSHHHHLENL